MTDNVLAIQISAINDSLGPCFRHRGNRGLGILIMRHFHSFSQLAIFTTVSPSRAHGRQPGCLFALLLSHLRVFTRLRSYLTLPNILVDAAETNIVVMYSSSASDAYMPFLAPWAKYVSFMIRPTTVCF